MHNQPHDSLRLISKQHAPLNNIWNYTKLKGSEINPNRSFVTDYEYLGIDGVVGTDDNSRQVVGEL